MLVYVLVQGFPEEGWYIKGVFSSRKNALRETTKLIRTHISDTGYTEYLIGEQKQAALTFVAQCNELSGEELLAAWNEEKHWDMFDVIEKTLDDTDKEGECLRDSDSQNW
jgi:hypothetical protein